MHIEQVKCICCDKEIKKIYTSPNNKLNDDSWYKGAVTELVCGYGSSFDMDTFYLGICDECIEINIKNQKIIKNV
jgi:hypothetical protein